MVLTRKAIPGILFTASILASSSLLAWWGGGPWGGGKGGGPWQNKPEIDSELKADVVRDKGNIGGKQPGTPMTNISPRQAIDPKLMQNPELKQPRIK